MSFSQNFLALLSSTAGSLFTALGMIFMKIANIKVEKTKKIPYHTLEMVLGILLTIVGLVFNGCKLF